MTISGELEILLENTENSVELQEVKEVIKITKKSVNVVILLQNGAEIVSNLGIINIKYKGTRMKSKMSEKYGLYYLHA